MASDHPQGGARRLSGAQADISRIKADDVVDKGRKILLDPLAATR